VKGQPTLLLQRSTSEGPTKPLGLPILAPQATIARTRKHARKISSDKPLPQLLSLPIASSRLQTFASAPCNRSRNQNTQPRPIPSIAASTPPRSKICSIDIAVIDFDRSFDRSLFPSAITLLSATSELISRRPPLESPLDSSLRCKSRHRATQHGIQL